jgi:hypothetical protein
MYKCLLLFTDIHHVQRPIPFTQSKTITTVRDCSTKKQSNMIHIGRILTQLYTHYFTQTLTTLNVWKNEIGDERAQHLADALRDNTVILILPSSISYTHIHFFTQILTTLDLEYNQIGAVGAQHLADALRDNTVIPTLSSSISYTHLHFFTQTLIALYLRFNQIGDEFQDHVEELIERNRRMIKS